mmetsp:Transcript_1764/g.3787  ORF Transcript_1764/g.3787 Transcript_1764/m.3787 type:complete len:102 (-) Transcript_1764:274-579(-)|eukprot:CAMPEP_0172308680 /NCGR_PEP_ID=MMETSP1058-20130122/9209_1 /TAXON_ID=83371 /ORGANISM="Detonula confervacea, Strain CCMP 353" /LENGTH=101 /DNA_ID=CAMNT_0013021155 /DNA_START=164 /DNA_END=469 /DNA_ORIENTATION=-
MWSHIAILLSEKSFMAQSIAFDPFTENRNNIEDVSARLTGDPVTDMGGDGTGGPWWIWLIVGVLVFLLCACLGYGLYNNRKKVQHDQKSNDDGLDEPLFLA